MKLSIKVAVLTLVTLVVALILSSAVYASSDAKPVDVNVTVDDYIQLTVPGNVSLSNIVGAGDDSENSTTWRVTTNSDNGYELLLSAGSSPAMNKGADFFADYAGGSVWSLGANESAFGFSVADTTHYQGLSGSTPIQIHSSNNEVADDATTVYFKAGVGTGHLQPSGNYTANLTVTASTL